MSMMNKLFNDPGAMRAVLNQHHYGAKLAAKIVTGALACLTVVGLPVGIPLLVHAFHQARKDYMAQRQGHGGVRPVIIRPAEPQFDEEVTNRLTMYERRAEAARAAHQEAVNYPRQHVMNNYYRGAKVAVHGPHALPQDHLLTRTEAHDLLTRGIFKVEPLSDTNFPLIEGTVFRDEDRKQFALQNHLLNVIGDASFIQEELATLNARNGLADITDRNVLLLALAAYEQSTEKTGQKYLPHLPIRW